MSVKAVMATILQHELASRGVNSLTRSDYEAVIEQLIKKLTELEFELRSRSTNGSQGVPT
ncbi:MULTISPECIES: hypothetical protein [Bradyrhizobium]|uniref:Uncharacterized protein n=3 Tax=Bradyrhizobium TaxID=374 RepID=A0A410VIP2_9BRAD|nr:MULTISPECIES: hypothetical protein [Bradyrhizobium]MCG2628061.1 hypothetical protein [Bradyrhizobium zhengyangense]MCG2643180.1 hypothetical protein [Bradyrhizobium zhengyangense]MCG2670506.1 hypothetical protein [Bradyrhizobium zhengyangense]MDN4985759.1 hypothetical protein [Bradyrhizobium sp. WYCCWR 13022]MDT4736600.1 hypothetical protein [Bradyrhizobium sp. WYCCWR 12699]